MNFDVSSNAGIGAGGWVHSYSPGIWQISRILDGFQELRFKPEDRKRASRRRLAMARRFLDSAWEKSFTAEACDVDLIDPISDAEWMRLLEYQKLNPDAVLEFDRFPGTIDFMLELRCNTPAGATDDELLRLASIVFGDIGAAGVTNDEVLQRLTDSPLRRWRLSSIGSVIIRFLCKDHELRDGQFVFRAFDIHLTQ